MEDQTKVIKEKAATGVVYNWADVLFFCILSAALAGLIMGLTCYRAGEIAVCQKLGVAKIKTYEWRNKCVFPKVTVEYAPVKEVK